MFLVSFGLKMDQKVANIEFEELVYDFGSLDEGEKAFHDFEFSNTGDAPLIISDVEVSCGCTTPSFPKEAIAPGEKSSVRIGFNSKGKSGRFDKSVTVVSNAEDSAVRLRIVGRIIPTH